MMLGLCVYPVFGNRIYRIFKTTHYGNLFNVLGLFMIDEIFKFRGCNSSTVA